MYYICTVSYLISDNIDADHWIVYFYTAHAIILGLKRYTAVSILFDSFCSVRSSIRFPYFRFGPFRFLATLMQGVNELRTDIECILLQYILPHIQRESLLDM